MKFLLLNPQINAGHKLLEGLKGLGVTVILAKDGSDALKRLKAEGDSVDLALLHREGPKGAGTPGVDIIAKIKAEKSLKDLPIVLTSDAWKDPDFAKHQKSSAGAHGYLRSPFTLAQLRPVVEGVLGVSLDGQGGSDSSPLGFELESATRLFKRSELPDGTTGSIRLDMSDFGVAPESEPSSEVKSDSGSSGGLHEPTLNIVAAPPMETAEVPEVSEPPAEAAVISASEPEPEPEQVAETASEDQPSVISSFAPATTSDAEASHSLAEGVETRPDPSTMAPQSSVKIAEGLETAPAIAAASSGSASSSDGGIAISEAPAESVLELQVRPEKSTSPEPEAPSSTPAIDFSPAASLAPSPESEAAPEPESQSAPEPSPGISFEPAAAFEPAPTQDPVAGPVEDNLPTAGTGIEFSPSASFEPEATFEPGPSFEPAASFESSAPASSGELSSLSPAGTLSEGSNEPDAQAEEEMPYLYSKGAKSLASMSFAQPQGDAVVPGGAAQSPDMETMKKYLMLREQDVAALSMQLKTAREQVRALEENLRLEKGRNAELSHLVQEQDKKVHDLERERDVAAESLQAEMSELKFQIKAKTDKARLMEGAVREAQAEIEKLKDRVRQDIRKIRVREKELENRLEIMRKDSEALIGAREGKIIELKRKLDLLEFNMDLLQDQYNREKDNSAKLRERLAKASQVVRVVGGLLDSKGAAQLGELADDISGQSSPGDGSGEAA